MRIDINQQKISIRDKYKVHIDGHQTHTASSELFHLLSVINLFDTSTSRPRSTISKRWSFLRSSYDIRLYDNNILEFRTISIWNLHYQCQFGASLFDIYAHRGRRYSVFKNGIQVAWWDKEMVTWFEGDNYKIIADNDCDQEMIIAFCLILDDSRSNQRSYSGNMVTFDLGNIGWKLKKFDEEWRPKF